MAFSVDFGIVDEVFLPIYNVVRMKMMTKNFLGWVRGGVLLGASFVFAAPWTFPYVPIVSRAQRGATESWRYFTPQGYTNWLERTALYTDWLAGSGEDKTGEFAKRKARETLNLAREEFLVKNYPEELVYERIIKQVDGKYLYFPLSYHTAKTKIVLHHTVTRQVTSFDDAKKSLQEMYKQHTITQGRGDIGYNLLIDPFGRIYEGRAGGKDVVGAHAEWNNTRTIGVSLMGNYDIHKPSTAMWWSLKKLLLGLALQYGIDPFTKQQYFTPIAKDPWLVASTHTSIVGHSDTKNTACPGTHVEERLPALRSDIDTYLRLIRSRGMTSLKQFHFLPKKIHVFMQGDSAQATYAFPDRVVRDCKLFGDGVTLTQCGGDGKRLFVSVTRQTSSPSGTYALFVDTDAGAVWIDLVVVWQQQLDEVLATRKRAHPVTQQPTKQITKIEHQISVDQAKNLLAGSVGVLLYEPTTALDHREFQCEGGCAVLLDTKRFNQATLIRVQPSSENPDRLTVFVDLKKYETSSIRLLNPKSVITITNRARGSTDYPLNYFRGDIAIQQESYATIQKQEKTGWTVVNHLPVDSYLHGVAESIDTQHPQKLQTLALLAKGYLLFYLGGNRHPSVPAGVSYQAIDDPRLFQKYVGAGIEQTTPRRQKAVDLTKTKLVTYDGYLPILPYFHCSAGFTRSGLELFGWTDTPWLGSKLDVASCAGGEFEGHGVGLSGEGAEKLAQKGATHAQIIRYYYPGVKIVAIK